MESGRVAVIFGGASGIGLAVARLCKQKGMIVVIADVDDKLMAEVKTEFSDGLVVHCDATNEKDVKSFADQVYSKYQDCGFLLNNTGIVRGDSAFTTSLADWRAVMKVTFEAFVIGTSEFVPRMLKQSKKNAVIVNTASVSGLMNSAMTTGLPYTIAKHAARLYSEGLAFELQKTPISVHCLCPGPVRTRLMQNSKKDGAAFTFESRVGGLSEKVIEKGLTPEEVAQKLDEGIQKGLFYIVVTRTSEYTVSYIAELMRCVADDVEHGGKALSFMKPTPDKAQAMASRMMAANKRRTGGFL